MYFFFFLFQYVEYKDSLVRPSDNPYMSWKKKIIL